MKIISLLKEMDEGYKFDIGDFVLLRGHRLEHYRVIDRFHSLNDILERGDKFAVGEEVIISRIAAEHPEKWGNYYLEDIYEVQAYSATTNWPVAPGRFYICLESDLELIDREKIKIKELD